MDHVTLAGALDGIVGGLIGGLAALGGTWLALQHERKLAVRERLDDLADVALRATGTFRRAATYGTDLNGFRQAFDNWSESELIFHLRLRKVFPGAAKLLDDLRLMVLTASKQIAAQEADAIPHLSAALRAHTEGIARWTEDHDVYEHSHIFDADSMIASIGPEPFISDFDVKLRAQ